jgi:putative tricarboxylic transport membrane protein
MEEKRKQRPGERWLTWFLLGFGLFALSQSIRISGFQSLSSAGAFPIFVSSVLIFSVIFIMLKNRRKTIPVSSRIKEELALARVYVFPKMIVIYMLILFGYMFLLSPLHFLGSSFVFLIVSVIYLKGTSWRYVFFTAAGMVAGIYLVFQYLFKVILW